MEATEQKQYFSYLDALRCLAFLAVFYAHSGTIFTGATITESFPLNYWKKFTVYGSYGVNFFFVLSGFLITYLLLKEKDARGNISIKNFYIKRILRIWPVYLITLFFSMFLLPFLIPSSTYEVLTLANPNMSFQTFFAFLFFVGNFYQCLGIGMGALSIGILWSVCIEEQFYLVWPWIVKWFNTRKLAIITVLLISLSLLYKFLWADDRVANYYLPWSVGMDLAFGALLGIGYFLKKNKQIILVTLSTLGVCILIVIGTVILGSPQVKPVLIESLRLFKTPMIDCVFALIIFYFIQRTSHISKFSLFHISKQKIKSVLIYLGKISYGLYAYHAICFMLVVSILYRIGLVTTDVSRTAFFTTVLASISLTILSAHLSSKLVEGPILKLKNRLK